MQAWNQWGSAAAGYAAAAAAAYPAAGAQPAPYPVGYPYYTAPAAPAMPPAAPTPDMTGYSAQQWTVMQQQWQQWQQWQQQFQQWQQQYGDKYQESMSATMGSMVPGQGPTPLTAVPPPTEAAPPPLPPPEKTATVPPPPPEETDPSPATDVYRSQTSKPPPPINTVVGTTTTPELYPHSVPYSNFSPYSVPPPTMQQPPPSVPPPPPAVPPPQSNSWGTDTNKRPFDTTIGDQFPGEKKMRSDFHNPGLPPDRGRWIGDDHNKIQDLHNKDNPDELSEAEKAFDIQFKQWEEQFNKWKEQNINHPDKTQYREYEAKWESWREQLLQRREQMRRKRENASKLATTDAARQGRSKSSRNSTADSGTMNNLSESSDGQQQGSFGALGVVGATENTNSNSSGTLSNQMSFPSQRVLEGVGGSSMPGLDQYQKQVPGDVINEIKGKQEADSTGVNAEVVENIDQHQLKTDVTAETPNVIHTEFIKNTTETGGIPGLDLLSGFQEDSQTYPESKEANPSEEKDVKSEKDKQIDDNPNRESSNTEGSNVGNETHVLVQKFTCEEKTNSEKSLTKPQTASIDSLLSNIQSNQNPSSQNKPIGNLVQSNHSNPNMAHNSPGNNSLQHAGNTFLNHPPPSTAQSHNTQLLPQNQTFHNIGFSNNGNVQNNLGYPPFGLGGQKMFNNPPPAFVSNQHPPNANQNIGDGQNTFNNQNLRGSGNHGFGLGNQSFSGNRGQNFQQFGNNFGNQGPQNSHNFGYNNIHAPSFPGYTANVNSSNNSSVYNNQGPPAPLSFGSNNHGLNQTPGFSAHNFNQGSKPGFGAGPRSGIAAREQGLPKSWVDPSHGLKGGLLGDFPICKETVPGGVKDYPPPLLGRGDQEVGFRGSRVGWQPRGRGGGGGSSRFSEDVDSNEQDEDLMNDPFADEENMSENHKEHVDPSCNVLEMTGKCEPKRDVDDRLNPDTWPQSRRFELSSSPRRGSWDGDDLSYPGRRWPSRGPPAPSSSLDSIGQRIKSDGGWNNTNNWKDFDNCRGGENWKMNDSWKDGDKWDGNPNRTGSDSWMGENRKPNERWNDTDIRKDDKWMDEGSRWKDGSNRQRDDGENWKDYDDRRPNDGENWRENEKWRDGDRWRDSDRWRESESWKGGEGWKPGENWKGDSFKPSDDWKNNDRNWRRLEIWKGDQRVESQPLNKSWELETNRRDWKRDFNLEPATVVDYRHRTAGPTIPVTDILKTGPQPFSEAVQTFDYAHGSRRTVASDNQSSDSWRSSDLHCSRDRDDKVRNTPRDWSRPEGRWERGRENEDFGKHDNRWDQDIRSNRGDVQSSKNDRLGHRTEDESSKCSLHTLRNSGERWTRSRDRGETRERRGSSNTHRESRKSSSPKKDLTHYPPPPDAPPPPTLSAPPPPEVSVRTVLVEDLLSNPGRNNRPNRLVVILRGPPGSGKTFVTKLIKDKEVEMGGSAPRILCLDDYFMVETEKEDKDPETGRKIVSKVMEYEYEAGMDKHYRNSLLKAFRKTVNDGYFPFIIVDCINDKVKHFEEMWSYAKQKGFQVYICEMDIDATVCSKRNIHNRSEKDINDIIKNWEETPKHYLRLDVRSLLQAEAIMEVEMEDTTAENDDLSKQELEKNISNDSETKNSDHVKEDEPENKDVDEDLEYSTSYSSKWERMDPSGDKLNRLDGLARMRKAEDKPRTLEDWLQLSDEYSRRENTPGKKRVRWADLEEKREQEKMRAIGFVVGQTDWSRMTDPTFGESALTQTKYI